MLTSQVLRVGKQNLFEVVQTLRARGVGRQLQRCTWQEDSFWTLTAIQPALDQKHGTAWGVLTWKGGQQQEQPVMIRGSLKRVWRLKDGADSGARLRGSGAQEDGADK
ncbi:hypothetical protein WJX81_001497 [Elliptochloris bilobata]|uniref:Uncharacterized protein n=1 Tax=Elliptochloris bilobata TaxID=381761 RepID=A0AAW1RCT7_9CHLO